MEKATAICLGQALHEEALATATAAPMRKERKAMPIPRLQTYNWRMTGSTTMLRSSGRTSSVWICAQIAEECIACEEASTSRIPQNETNIDQEDQPPLYKRKYNKAGDHDVVLVGAVTKDNEVPNNECALRTPMLKTIS